MELVCKNCGRKYRVKKAPQEIDESLLVCPNCGGKLAPVTPAPEPEVVQREPKVEREGSRVKLEDLLITKDVALIYWDLGHSKLPVETTLREEGFEVKEISGEEDLRYWLRILVPKVVVIGTENEDLAKRLEEGLLIVPMEDYRGIFRVRVSSSFITLDPKEVFLSGTHLVCNPQDLEKFKEVYAKAKEYWQVLYAPFHRALEAIKEGEEV